MAIKRTAKKETEQQAPAITYDVEVTRAREFDNGIALDLTVNGVKIYGCWYRTYEDRKKPGDEKAFIGFPSRQGSDGKYYQHAWFPVSDELLADIEKQIEAKLAELKHRRND